MTNDDRIIALLLTAPDGTYTVTDTALTSHIFSYGYQVGRPDIHPAVEDPTSIDEIRTLVLASQDNGCNVGIWTDDNGVRCFDVSCWYTFMPHSLRVAERLGERAIWDWSTMTAVEVAPEPQPESEEVDLVTWVEQKEDGHPNGTRVYQCMSDRGRSALRGFDPDPEKPDVFEFSGPDPVEPWLVDGLTVLYERRR